jgi:protein-L-isoaspartate O-methyltransferase
VNTTTTAREWSDHARQLADLLRDRKDIRSPEWYAAFAAVPRHRFVPRVFEQDAAGHWRCWDATDDWDRVYSPRTLVTVLVDRRGFPEPASSSTNPELMARMLEMLDIRDGHRVLEIGTGTGYNAALLAHRLGDGNVFSVDVDEDFVDLARNRLASAGYRPTLVAVDGEGGLPEYGPFDRIIATCSVPAVPHAWADQLVPGGTVIVDLKRAISAGNLVHLHKLDDGSLEGRFAPRMASFMAMRHHGEKRVATPASGGPATIDRRQRLTSAACQPWQTAPVVWFLAQLCGLPSGVLHGAILDPDTRKPTAATLTAPDRSHATVNLADGTVTEVGDLALWEPVELAHSRWVEAGQPGWDRFGLTVTRDEQVVWLDEPYGPYTWRIPANR